MYSMKHDDNGTQIRIKKPILEKLKKCGKAGDSYSDVIDRLASKELGD